jgi:hypothetical protein
MNIIDRIKNILITPKTEWQVIKGESATPQSLTTSYVIPLAVISCVGAIVQGLLFAGALGLKFFMIAAVIGLIAEVIGFYLASYIIDALATSFSSEKNINRSAQLVAYSRTPAAIGGLLSFIPVVGRILPLVGALYGIYIMYLGMEPMKNTPEDKKVVYMIVSFLVMFVLYAIVIAVLGIVLYGALGMSRPGFF